MCPHTAQPQQGEILVALRTPINSKLRQQRHRACLKTPWRPAARDFGWGRRAGILPAGSGGHSAPASGTMRQSNTNCRLEAATTGRQDACPATLAAKTGPHEVFKPALNRLQPRPLGTATVPVAPVGVSPTESPSLPSPSAVLLRRTGDLYSAIGLFSLLHSSFCLLHFPSPPELPRLRPLAEISED